MAGKAVWAGCEAQSSHAGNRGHQNNRLNSLTPQLVLHSFCFNLDSSGRIIKLILKCFSQNSEF